MGKRCASPKLDLQFAALRLTDSITRSGSQTAPRTIGFDEYPAQARIDEISRKTGVRAMMLDARNERLARWYERYDFIRFPHHFRMFKSIDATRALKLIEDR